MYSHGGVRVEVDPQIPNGVGGKNPIITDPDCISWDDTKATIINHWIIDFNPKYQPLPVFLSIAYKCGCIYWRLCCVVKNADKSARIVRPYPSNRTVSISSSASFTCRINTDSTTSPNVQVTADEMIGKITTEFDMSQTWSSSSSSYLR